MLTLHKFFIKCPLNNKDNVPTKLAICTKYCLFWQVDQQFECLARHLPQSFRVLFASLLSERKDKAKVMPPSLIAMEYIVKNTIGKPKSQDLILHVEGSFPIESG